jgi:uncharacterized SAM-binding protein YcdF (DUF218 family)
MFFALSKILAFVLKPINIVLILVGFGYFSPSARRRARWFRWAFLLLLFWSNRWVLNQVAHYYERGYRSIESIETPYETGILLGGFTNLKSGGPILNFSQASNRLTTTLELYRQGKIKRILISGGNGALFDNNPPESEVVADWLRRVGVPDSVLLIENRSRNTYENALCSRALIDSLHLGQRHLLITSAWHLPRAGACFRRVGLPCHELGTDYFYDRYAGNNPWRWIEPSWEPLMQWEALLKEWIGYGVYWLKGYV